MGTLLEIPAWAYVTLILNKIHSHVAWLIKCVVVYNRSKRIEYLMLQQNGLSAVPSAFTSFNKLKELRIDRNQIKKLDNLSGCSSLRLLDISYNQLTSLEVCMTAYPNLFRSSCVEIIFLMTKCA